MSEETVVATPVEPTPVVDATKEPVVTATLEPVETPEETKPPKTFSQEEVDEIVAKRLAREQRKLEREKPAPQVPADETEAKAMQLAEQMLQKRDEQRQMNEIIDGYQDREEAAREKYADFEQVAYNPRVRVTEAMAKTIQLSESGPEVAYFLGQNPKEAERISKLHPIRQAMEIGRLEAKLLSDPPARKTSSAPSPITPVTPSTKGTHVYDTTDPRAAKELDTSEWIARERARQVRNQKAATT